MIAILSFPRSGNHFMRYIIEHLSGRPTKGCIGNEHADGPICRRKGVKFLGHVKGSSCGRKYHSPRHGLLGVGEKDKRYGLLAKELILIQRYPLHSLVSHKTHQIPFSRKLLQKCNSWNLDILNFYQHFPYKKICIYFEDLVERQPEKEIKKIGDFINAPDERIEEFLTNIEKYTRDSKSHRQWSKQDKPSLEEAFASHAKEMMTCLNHPLISTRYGKENDLWL